jgi:Cu2+-exporting ATPase
MSKTIELKIEGMSCNHCEMRIKKALESVPGVESAEPDHKKGIAKVTLKEDVSLENLSDVVKEVGYKVKK